MSACTKMWFVFSPKRKTTQAIWLNMHNVAAFSLQRTDGDAGASVYIPDNHCLIAIIFVLLKPYNQKTETASAVLWWLTCSRSQCNPRALMEATNRSTSDAEPVRWGGVPSKDDIVRDTVESSTGVWSIKSTNAGFSFYMRSLFKVSVKTQSNTWATLVKKAHGHVK